jgi:hypothetical protein
MRAKTAEFVGMSLLRAADLALDRNLHREDLSESRRDEQTRIVKDQ